MEVEFQDMDEDDTSTDIRDIEFRLKNNPAQVQVRPSARINNCSIQNPYNWLREY